MPHRVDFGPGSAGVPVIGAFRKQVAFGNGIGAIGFGVNAQNLPPQIVGVTRVPLIVPTAAARTLISLGGLLVTRVIADGQV